MKKTTKWAAVVAVVLMAGVAVAAPREDLDLNVIRIDGTQVVATANELNTLSGGTGTVTAATFSGSGASLTALPAASLTGNIASARMTNGLAQAFSNVSVLVTIDGTNYMMQRP